MFSITDEIIIDDQFDNYEIEWVKESNEILDDVTYNVYQGSGDSSLVKLLIQEEIVAQL